MNAINGTREYARRVNSLAEVDLLPPIQYRDRSMGEMLSFAHELRDAGLDLGPRIEKIESLWTAAQESLAFDPAKTFAALDIDKTTTAQLRTLMESSATTHAASHQYSIDTAIFDASSTVILGIVERRLLTVAAEALRTDADKIIAKLSTDFNTAAKIVVNAFAAGLGPTTDTASILNDGTTEAITAYRALPAATAKLDKIAATRLRMSDVLNYRPNWPHIPTEDQPDVASFVTFAAPLTLDGADSRWLGVVEHVQVEDETYKWSSIKATRKKELGGRWLSLVDGGYMLRLNTAAEVQAILVADYES